MVKCPACLQIVEALTSKHCKECRGLSKKEFLDTYGKPISMFRSFVIHSGEPSFEFSKYDFLNSQQLTERFRSKTRNFRERWI